MHERRGVDEFDRGPRGNRRLALRRGQEDEQRAQPLPAGRERLGADRRDEAWANLDSRGQPLFEPLEVRVEPGALANRSEAHSATPRCSATIPRAKSR